MGCLFCFILTSETRVAIVITPFIDKTFCTEHSYKAALINANEKLSEYLRGALRVIDLPESSLQELSSLQWTDSKSGLIELIYALQEKGSFNNGKATLKEITNYFERIFSVELGNTSRTFQVILSRKMDYANFLEKLKKKFLERIDRNESRHIK